jgi:hypothetical protein
MRNIESPVTSKFTPMLLSYNQGFKFAPMLLSIFLMCTSTSVLTFYISHVYQYFSTDFLYFSCVPVLQYWLSIFLMCTSTSVPTFYISHVYQYWLSIFLMCTSTSVLTFYISHVYQYFSTDFLYFSCLPVLLVPHNFKECCIKCACKMFKF